MVGHSPSPTLVGVERPEIEAHSTSLAVNYLGLSVEAEEGQLSPRSSSLQRCDEIEVEEVEDGDGHKDIPTIAIPLSGRKFEFKEI